VIVRFVNIGGLAYHHCLSFLFIMVLLADFYITNGSDIDLEPCHQRPLLINWRSF